MKRLNVSSGLKDSRRGLVFVNEKTMKDLDLLLDDPVLLSLIEKQSQQQGSTTTTNTNNENQSKSEDSSADKQIQFTSIALIRVNNDLKENGKQKILSICVLLIFIYCDF